MMYDMSELRRGLWRRESSRLPQTALRQLPKSRSCRRWLFSYLSSPRSAYPKAHTLISKNAVRESPRVPPLN